MFNKIDNDLAFVHSALNLRSRRQEVIASNIANADTPGYKARDIDFSQALRSAMGAASGPMAMSRTAEAHLAGRVSGAGASADLLYRGVLQPSLDGNTVDMDQERAHFAENTMHYQFMLERARSKVERMKMALAGDR